MFTIGNIEKKLLDLLAEEEPLNPFTDQELANKLGVARATVTLLRAKLGIANAKERRSKALAALIHRERKGSETSCRSVVRSLAEKGIRVSHATVSKLVHSETAKVEEMRPQINKVGNNQVDNGVVHQAFQTLVGAEGSLRFAIEMAQAAVSYPGGLHTLITGPTGVGKTELASAMYRYAVAAGRLSKDAPFVSFNCADYADNPQLLMAYLFGCKKGAYTGAIEDRVGVVEIANGGVLFLDEIHRLPPQGQEMLFSILDRGCFRRLGETTWERKTAFLLIAATSFPPDKALIEAMRRRIPVVIELPPLCSRPREERRELVIRFFTEEAAKIGSSIELDPMLVEALLLYPCPGNVGQLKADIQVACARAFLKYITGTRGGVVVYLDDAPQTVLEALTNNSLRDKLWPSLEGRIIVTPKTPDSNHRSVTSDVYMVPTNVYEWLESYYRKRNDIQDPAQRALVVGSELERFIESQLRYFETNRALLTDKKIGDLSRPSIIESLKRALVKEFPYALRDTPLITCIAMHLATSAQRYSEGGSPINPEVLLSFGRVNERLREIARRILQHVAIETGISFPPYEDYMLALYLSHAGSKESAGGSPAVGILIVSYGRVASAVRDVVGSLLPGVKLEIMELEYGENWERLRSRLETALKETDGGAGVAVVTDDGLDSIIRTVAAQCGVKIRTFTPLCTTNVLKVARNVNEGKQLSEVVETAGQSIPGEESKAPEEVYLPQAEIIPDLESKKPPVVLVTCITGKGWAERFASELKTSLNMHAEVWPVSVVEAESVWKRERPRVIAVIGPFDPGLSGVVYYPVNKILSPEGRGEVERLIQRYFSRQASEGLGMREVLDPDLIFLDVEANEREQIIRWLCKKLEKKGYIKKSFVDTVLERERMGSTYVGNGVAIPHGIPDEVVKQAIAIGRVKRDCLWADETVRLVFLLALRREARLVIKQLYERVLSNKELINELLNAEDKAAFTKLLFYSVGF